VSSCTVAVRDREAQSGSSEANQSRGGDEKGEGVLKIGEGERRSGGYGSEGEGGNATVWRRAANVDGVEQMLVIDDSDRC
jgi:hypothetical protein